ncbi:DUF2905 domain-containing protein [Methylomonas methanica]|uniref:DUF2905 family protein n=1 Tax=Methylomonas methanica (strain DSM 25384 / MC09) TaxID=857087 RepID=G0A602_METMM|nr:DUF2905 domain-containing protein [Methylomonas methanica]AEG00452.1 hypothetical protein Metme_2046 [Methylomonas methanica MC09]
MDIGKLLITTGLALAALGLTVKYAPWLINWFGKLPGDINIENANSRVFIPITSMIVISLLLTLIANFWFRK